MNRKTLLQIAAIVLAGILLALVANAFASRDRKMTLTGSYLNALKVPPRETAPIAPTTIAPVPIIQTTTTAPAPAPAPVTETPATQTTATQPTATAAIETVGIKPAVKSPQPATPAPAVEEDPLKRFPPHSDKPYVEIGFADVKWLHEKNVLFLDARRTSVYEQGHIPGAQTYSVWESDIDQKVRKLFDERSDPRQQLLPIVIYCSGGDCEDSHMLAQKLWGIQFNNIYVYKDGFPDWQQHGAPVHTGANP